MHSVTMPFLAGPRFKRRTSKTQTKAARTPCRPQASIGDLTVDTHNISDDEASLPREDYLLEKSVSFRLDKKTGDIDREVFMYDGRLQRKAKKDLYYSGKEFNLAVTEVRALVDTVGRECPDIPLLLNHLCTNAKTLTRDLTNEDREMLVAWSCSQGRGLEEHINTKTAERRKLANQRILKFQSRISSSDVDERWRALAERASMESQQATCFAAIIGIGDALVVRKERRQSSSNIHRPTRRRSSTSIAV